jgi:ElaB/YqjD/DUF883 family membrane-anchored ribosome-binding protein
MQKMGSMPGGPGPMDQMPGGIASGGSAGSSAGRGRSLDEGITSPIPGGPGPMDPPVADAMGATMQGGMDLGDEPAGLLPSPRSDSERFFEDLKAFVADTEHLLRQARTLGGEGAVAARAEFERRLSQAREGFDTARVEAMDRMNDWRDRTEAYVRRDPWKAVGIAAGVGFLIGMLGGRSHDEDDE